MQNRSVVDINVGRLAKWLRIMGYDTLFASESADNKLVRIVLRDSRTLVTEDSGITQRRAARSGQMQVIHLKDDALRGQLRQVGMGTETRLQTTEAVTGQLPPGNPTQVYALSSVPPAVL